MLMMMMGGVVFLNECKSSNFAPLTRLPAIFAAKNNHSDYLLSLFSIFLLSIFTEYYSAFICRVYSAYMYIYSKLSCNVHGHIS